MTVSNIFINGLSALKTIAARYGDTPSGFRGDIKNATKEILKGEHLAYKESIPSQRTYIFGELNFPVSKERAIIDPSLPQYDVNFGLDTLYIPKQDSVIIEELMGRPHTKALFGNGPFFTLLNETDVSKPNYYDAGKHTIIPSKDKDGKHVMIYSDVYDFNNTDAYMKKYSTARGDAEQDLSNSPLAKLAIGAMKFIGLPYEVHQTVPIKYVDKNPVGLWDSSKGSIRSMFKALAKLHNVLFKTPLENIPEEELDAAYNNPGMTGNELVQYWKEIGFVKRNGGKLNNKEFDYFVSTLPDNQKPSKDFDVYRYWELNSKPKDFEEAKQLGMYTLEDDGLYHAKSVAKNGEEYEWMKSLNHPNRGMELMWYEFNPEFKKEYQIQVRDGKLFYIPRKKNGGTMNYLDFFKKGGKSGIYIKKKNRGKFTDYCGGTVTEECIQKGKHSSNPTTRKRATFAANARKWKHQTGGELINPTKETFFSRTKVEIPEQKKYTAYIPEDNTSSTYQREATSSSTSYDLSGYTLPTVTITTSTASKSDNKLHTDINGLLDLFKKYNIHVYVTSGYRKGAKTKQGKTSFHASGRALDIVPKDGDFAKLSQIIKNTPEIKDYMISKGLGVYDETSPETLRLTGGTNPHYHIGPDPIAQKFWLT